MIKSSCDTVYDPGCVRSGSGDRRKEDLSPQSGISSSLPQSVFTRETFERFSQKEVKTSFFRRADECLRSFPFLGSGTLSTPRKEVNFENKDLLQLPTKYLQNLRSKFPFRGRKRPLHWEDKRDDYSPDSTLDLPVVPTTAEKWRCGCFTARQLTPFSLSRHQQIPQNSSVWVRCLKDAKFGK